MPYMGQKWVMDRDAYQERRAIMEVEGADGLTASREASDCAYATRMGVVCTAGANRDWAPARAWCREIAARFGIDMAHALMKDINAMIETELNWRQ
jgi:hypothetical protein